MSTRLVAGYPVLVMDVCWSIDAQADLNALGRYQLAVSFCNESSVRLNEMRSSALTVDQAMNTFDRLSVVRWRQNQGLSCVPNHAYRFAEQSTLQQPGE
jgi:hypothetical protein